DILRQLNRQFVLRHWHDAAPLAQDHGDGRAPVALAADQPVAQAVVHRLGADALLLQPVDHGADAGVLAALLIADGRTAERPGVDHHARATVGSIHVLQQPVNVDGRLRAVDRAARDRKSTRLNSSHVKTSYAVVCLKTKT